MAMLCKKLFVYIIYFFIICCYISFADDEVYENAENDDQDPINSAKIISVRCRIGYVKIGGLCRKIFSF